MPPQSCYARHLSRRATAPWYFALGHAEARPRPWHGSPQQSSGMGMGTDARQPAGGEEELSMSNILIKSAWGSDDPTKAAFAFLHANAFADAGHSVQIFLLG